MKKYNYFDDDDLILDEIRNRVKTAEPEQKHDRAEVLDAIRAFSKDGSEKVISVARTALRRNPFEELENASKRKKRWVTAFMFFVFILFFVLLVLITVHSVTKQNEKIEKFNADAGTVCTQYIVQYGSCNYENLYDKYKVQGYRMTGLCYVREMDFDGDGTSELLMVYNDSGVFYVEVWGYNGKGKFATLYHEKATQKKKKTTPAWVTVYSRNNRYYIGVHDNKDISKVSLYTLRGDKFEKKMNCTYDEKAEAFSIRKKVDPLNFERIRLGVLSESKAIVTQNLVTDTIDGFSSGGGDAAVKAAAINASLNGSYYRIIEELNQKYGTAKYVEKNGLAYIKGLAVVDLIDFDNDGRDELMLIYRKTVKSRTEDYHGNYVSVEEDKYYIEIYRYNGNSAVIAYKGEGISNSLNSSADQYFVLEKKGGVTNYCHNSFSSKNYGRTINATSTVLKYNKTSFDTDFKASYHSDYGYTEYYIDDEYVRKSTFEEEGYRVPLFDGSEEYNDGTYIVTYLQRKSTSAGKIKSQVERTQQTIKKLNPAYDGE
ncbi:MAG: hypothetical protein E7520_01840 [Ruminococcaceae bacterium]|nr:hypothetical protein [Oscillospiraceae bacterium]